MCVLLCIIYGVACLFFFLFFLSVCVCRWSPLLEVAEQHAAEHNKVGGGGVKKGDIYIAPNQSTVVNHRTDAHQKPHIYVSSLHPFIRCPPTQISISSYQFFIPSSLHPSGVFITPKIYLILSILHPFTRCPLTQIYLSHPINPIIPSSLSIRCSPSTSRHPSSSSSSRTR